jgi:cell division protein FtsQ
VINSLFDKKDIESLLNGNGAFAVKGRSLKSFDLGKIGTAVGEKPWISDAELFFDNNGLLMVKVKERVPFGRVFTITGTVFISISNCARLPLSDNYLPDACIYWLSIRQEKLSADDKLLLEAYKIDVPVYTTQ